MSLYGLLKGTGPSGFGYETTAETVTAGLDLREKTYLLTGCNGGLGLESLRILGLRGAHILATARSEEKAGDAIASAGADATPIVCDLAEPDSVRAAVETIRATGRTLDGILCNAGIMALPRLEQKCGYELQFFTNHIGHFLLVTGLLDVLGDEARVTMTSSDAHKHAPRVGVELDNLSGESGYRPWRAYAQSKFANILFAKELSRRFAETRRTANAIHPGVIQTNLTRYMNPLAVMGLSLVGPIALKSRAQGAATQVYTTTHPDAGHISGEYLKDCNIAEARAPANDAALAASLWQISEEIASKV